MVPLWCTSTASAPINFMQLGTTAPELCEVRFSECNSIVRYFLSWGYNVLHVADFAVKTSVAMIKYFISLVCNNVEPRFRNSFWRLHKIK